MDAFRCWPALGMLVFVTGCRLVAHEEYWQPPSIEVYAPDSVACDSDAVTLRGCQTDLAIAQWYDRQGSPRATAAYLNVMERLGPTVEAESAVGASCCRTRKTFDHCLVRFLTCAQRHHQYSPGVGVQGIDEAGTRIVPVRVVGSAWRPEDIQSLHPVGVYHSKSLTRPVRRPGWGVPLVATRKTPTGLHPADQFVAPGTPFALTAVLRCNRVSPVQDSESHPQTVLEFHDPISTRRVHLGGESPPLAADLSAPLIYSHLTGEQSVDPFDWFIHPEMADEHDGLFFLEPYQPGKIPVVLIHGLLSSPSTWVDMANELRSRPGFSDRFQIWGFRYATGRPFVASAALLRRELATALHQLRSVGSDPAVDQIVLIGHSMGGLIAKSQISESGEAMWRSIANRPLSQIVADQEMKATLEEQFFFAPQPAIRRVVFIAVPHGGSTLATRFVGQVGTILVEPATAVKEQHRRLVDCNPKVFSREVSKRFPTSIDLLETRSNILRALYRLPVNCNVRMHSIIGDGRYSVGDGVGDGVVGVENARHPNVDSELFVPTTHTAIHRRDETICEVWRILQEHHRQFLEHASQPQLPAAPAPASPE